MSCRDNPVSWSTFRQASTASDRRRLSRSSRLNRRSDSGVTCPNHDPGTHSPICSSSSTRATTWPSGSDVRDRSNRSDMSCQRAGAAKVNARTVPRPLSHESAPRPVRPTRRTDRPRRFLPRAAHLAVHHRKLTGQTSPTEGLRDVVESAAGEGPGQVFVGHRRVVDL
jgi:hypothetical protein